MKKMQIFPYVCAILFPYFALIVFIYFSFLEDGFMFGINLLISFATAIILCVWCNKSAVSGKSNMKSVVMNIVTKICYIPVCFEILDFSFSTIIYPLSVILAFTGLYNIGNCIRLYRNRCCSRAKSVILCIMGFVHVLDIIGGIIQLVLSLKRKNI